MAETAMTWDKLISVYSIFSECLRPDRFSPGRQRWEKRQVATTFLVKEAMVL